MSRWHILVTVWISLLVLPSFADEQAPVSSQVKSGTFFVAPKRRNNNID